MIFTLTFGISVLFPDSGNSDINLNYAEIKLFSFILNILDLFLSIQYVRISISYFFAFFVQTTFLAIHQFLFELQHPNKLHHFEFLFWLQQ